MSLKSLCYCFFQLIYHLLRRIFRRNLSLIRLQLALVLGFIRLVLDLPGLRSLKGDWQLSFSVLHWYDQHYVSLKWYLKGDWQLSFSVLHWYDQHYFSLKWYLKGDWQLSFPVLHWYDQHYVSLKWYLKGDWQLSLPVLHWYDQYSLTLQLYNSLNQ